MEGKTNKGINRGNSNIRYRAKIRECEENLVNSEDRLKFALRNIPAVIANLDSNLRYVWVYNPQAGLTPEELLGEKFGTISFFEDQDRIRACLEDILTKGISVTQEVVATTKGKKSTFRFHAEPIKNAKGIITGVSFIALDITNRKMDEEALRKGEEQLRIQQGKLSLIYNNVSEVLFSLSVEPNNKFYFQSVNPSFLETTGLQENQVVGKSVQEVIPEPSLTLVLEKYNQAINDKRSIRWEEVTDYPSGQKYGEVTIAPLFDSSGRCIYLIGNVHDITDRKKAEEAVIESEGKFRSLFSNMVDGFAFCQMIYDQNGKPIDFIYLEINDAFEKLTGLKREKIVGKKVSEAIPGTFEANPEIFDIYGRVAKECVSERFEVFFKPLSIWLDIAVYSPKKGYFAAVFSNITDRKRAEESLKQAQAKLQEYASNLELMVEERTNKVRESEQRYHELYESFGEAFIAVDWELNVIHWNKAAERVTTVKAEDALGKKIYKVLPEFTSIDVTPYFEALKEQKPARFMMNVPSRETKKLSLFEVSTYPSSQGIIIIVVDKTEEEQIKRLSAIGATAGMVGHDIRNPLQAMISDVYLMRSELAEMPQCATKEGIKESLESLETNILYVNKIVGDLQDYTRPLQLHKAKIEVTDKINNALKDVRIPENIRVQVNTQKGIVVKTDPDFLRRALINLINNAVQAMPNGGDLTIEAKTKNAKVMFTVQDTGVGIPEKVKPNLFTPLFTTKSKGQGLGLAVVKRLVEALKGTITFESEEGKGTKFIIELPIT